MARYCGRDGHYTDVECAYAEHERNLVLSCDEEAHYWKERGHQFAGLYDQQGPPPQSRARSFAQTPSRH
jgi:hypothetical protein